MDLAGTGLCRGIGHRDHPAFYKGLWDPIVNANVVSFLKTQPLSLMQNKMQQYAHPAHLGPFSSQAILFYKNIYKQDSHKPT